MNLQGVKALLPLLNSKFTGSRGKWANGRCPLGPWNHGGVDNHPSFAVEAKPSGKSICKCLSCGFGGDLMDLLYEIRRKQKIEPAPGYDLATSMQLIAQEYGDGELMISTIPEYEDTQEPTNQPWPEEFLLHFLKATKVPMAMEYLKGRGVTAAMAEKLQLKFDQGQKRIGFPFWDYRGRLMGMQGRTIDPEVSLRYFQYGYNGKRNMNVWLGEHHMDLDRPLVLVEGPFDYAAILPFYDNVVASFTSGLSVQKMRRVADAVEIITFYDHGTGGDNARESIDKHIKGVPKTHIVPTEEEGDAGAMDPEVIAETLSQFVPLKSYI